MSYHKAEKTIAMEKIIKIILVLSFSFFIFVIYNMPDRNKKHSLIVNKQIADVVCFSIIIFTC